MDPQSTIRLRTGHDMPRLGLGTWQLTDGTAGAIEEALRIGYRMFDTAVDYGSQAGLGMGLQRSGIERGDIYIVTKIEEDDTPLDAVRRDLDELGLDYANLTLIHRPPENGAGEALWEGLIRAREDGLVRDIGVSNYSSDMLDTLAAATGETPVVNQIEWSPFGHSDVLQDHHRARNIVLMGYSPLTRGERLDDPQLHDIAAQHQRTPAQIILRWNLQRGIVPLPKANQTSHIEENFALYDFSLSDDDMQRIDRMNEMWSALGSSVAYA
ncbi:2,5-diketo-D-gluconate reductase A [Lutimaribacter pacificus]|uniref:2,5-diketo-D-gluconate reductase A n=3 Tax=Lutimaribacter pacificus TaxID=391948 RepID=A0A1H0LTB8_9RHOB|nr:2,5-diketo-D-gluconate reductase A [Lutimaribacter pacificus]SHK03566.1 2,5-diketo-D-gluconate reductase A [Lutimaribacter pacificus]